MFILHNSKDILIKTKIANFTISLSVIKKIYRYN